jgi:hypothetical protein
MHHMSRRQDFSSFSTSSRRIVSREMLSCSVNLTISPANRSSVQRARPFGAPLQAGGGYQQRLLFVCQFARRPGPWTLIQRPGEIAFHRSLLGSIHCGQADRDIAGNLLITGSRIRRQQNLRTLELAHRVLSTPQQPLQLAAFALSQLDWYP